MTGRVTRLNVEAGETAIMGTLNKDAATLLTISDMSILETKVKVDETDVSRIAIGDSAVIQIDAFPDTTFIGKVTEISNSSVRGAAAAAATTDQAIDYEVTVRVLNPPAETRPDFSSTAKIVTDTRTQALAIPIIAHTVREDSALRNTDQAAPQAAQAPAVQVGKRDVEGVFVVGADNKVTFRPVKVGIAGEKYFEVLDGLKQGAENRAILRIFDRWDRFDRVMGGALFVENIIVAYTLAEPLTADTLVIHFEKGCPAYKGVYQAINQLFVARSAGGFRFVNREQDVDNDVAAQGQAFLHPVEFLKKYKVTISD